MAITVTPKEGTEVAAKPFVFTGELAAALKDIEKKIPKTVMVANKVINPQRIPTGVFEFDLATNGGFPMGKYSIVYGPESSGKSNLCMCAVANAQKLPAPNNIVVWVDVEGTADPDWMAAHGIDVSRLLIVKPDYGEQAADLVDAFMHTEEVCMIVVDSIAAMISVSETETSTEKADVKGNSVLVKRMCNKLVTSFTQEAKRGHTPCVVLVNQTRTKIGVMFGDPETTPCGQTPRFLSSLSIRVYGKNKMVKEISNDLPIFKEVSMTIKKAKLPINMNSAQYDHVVYAHDQLRVGQSNSFNLVLGHLKAHGIIAKAEKGSGWVLNGTDQRPTLKHFADSYYEDLTFRVKLQGQVIALLAKNAYVPPDADKNEPVDET